MSENFFFIVGAQRSSTTYLYNLLAEHPQICMASPVSPEPKFFLDDEAYGQGIAHYRAKYFSHCEQAKIYGEKSTSYIESEKAAKRIRESFPDAKIIMLLRNPVERALSNYSFSVKNGLESRTLEEVFLEHKPEPLLKKNVSVSPYDYLGRGEYIRYIELYEQYFKRENIAVLIKEELTGNREEIAKVYAFLGCDSGFVPPSLGAVINASETKESNSEVRATLVEYFRPSVKELEKKLDRDLGIWSF